MITNIENRIIRIEPSEWRYSASIVGIINYFEFHKIEFFMNEEYIEFDKSLLEKEKYLEFVENHFKVYMPHLGIEDILKSNDDF